VRESSEVDEKMASSWPFVNVGILAIIIFVGVFVIWRMLRDRRSGFPLKDERTQRITGTAATYTFYIGSYFMIALMLANLLNLEFLSEPLLDTGYALIASILVNSLTFLGLRMYFDRKGDF
jgi:uncharacterized membrane protein